MLAQSSSNQSSPGPTSGQFHRILTVTATEQVILDVELPQGDLQIQYRRDGEVSITGIAQTVSGTKGIADSLGAVLDVEQNGNHIKVRQARRMRPRRSGEPALGIASTYRIGLRSLRSYATAVRPLTESWDR